MNEIFWELTREVNKINDLWYTIIRGVRKIGNAASSFPMNPKKICLFIYFTNLLTDVNCRIFYILVFFFVRWWVVLSRKVGAKVYDISHSLHQIKVRECKRKDNNVFDFTIKFSDISKGDCETKIYKFKILTVFLISNFCTDW